MMGTVITFPKRHDGPAPGGTIHVWRRDDGTFEIGHESRSGGSWGSFSTWPDAGQAISAAHRLNAEYDGECEVHIPDNVRRAVVPVHREIEF